MLPTTAKDAYLRKLGFEQVSLYSCWDYPLEQDEPSFLPFPTSDTCTSSLPPIIPACMPTPG